MKLRTTAALVAAPLLTISLAACGASHPASADGSKGTSSGSSSITWPTTCSAYGKPTFASSLPNFDDDGNTDAETCEWHAADSAAHDGNVGMVGIYAPSWDEDNGVTTNLTTYADFAATDDSADGDTQLKDPGPWTWGAIEPDATWPTLRLFYVDGAKDDGKNVIECELDLGYAHDMPTDLQAAFSKVRPECDRLLDALRK